MVEKSDKKHSSPKLLASLAGGLRDMTKTWYGLLILFFIAITATGPACRLATHIRMAIATEQAIQAAQLLTGQLCATPSNCAPALMYAGPVQEAPLRMILEQLDEKKITWLCLRSLGGDVNTGDWFITEIEKRKINTCVVPATRGIKRTTSMKCVSECTEIWLAGQRRVLASGDLLLGFHKPYAGMDICCYFSNQLQVFKDYIKHLDDKRDKEARKYLRTQGRNYGPDEYYDLRTDEAEKLGLISHEDAITTWQWIETQTPAHE